MRSRCGWCVLSMGLATLGLLVLLTQFSALHATAQGGDSGWPLTADGQSRFAGWSPDGRTMLVNRWGAVVGDGPTRQTLSELWAVSLLPDKGKGQGWGSQDYAITRLSENAIQPAYAGDGQRLAYLTFVGDGRWEVRVLDLASGQEKSWGPADWRTSPAWIGQNLAFARDGRVWLSSEGITAQAFDLPALLAGTRIRLSSDGSRAAWSDGTHLWAVSHPGAEPQLLAGPHPQPLSQSWERGANTQVLNFTWSPNGQTLAYVVAEDSSPELWVASVDSDEAPVLLIHGREELFSAPAWSPDGRTLAFSRTPLGAETASASDIWLVNADGGNLRPLLHNDLEESSPAWSPDSRYIAFNRAGDVWLLDTSRMSPSPSPAQGEESSEDFSNLDTPAVASAAGALAQKTPPDTIRVIHDAANTCRSVPVGQIDLIDFEDYVKRVLPAEVYTTWPTEALKAQAVAARTYGWKHVLIPPDPNWDVTDWTEYQVMCDATHPSTDAAVDATQGQYVAWRGDIIYALYASENGSPTKTYTSTTFPDGVPYLMAVDDPVSFGQKRYGHGWGMSQWGAYRWAEWHGWGYQQILTHYYTGVTVELPSNGGPTPLGGVTLPWSDYFITSNRVYITANASDEASAVSAVGFYVVTDTATLLVTDTMGSDGWSTVWDVTALSDTTSTGLTLSLRVSDTQGYVQSQVETARIGLDRQPPANTTAAIGDAYTNTITVTISSLSATDPDPGSGVQTMAFSNEGWSWEGEDTEEMHHESGEEVTDGDALNGRAWRGRASVHSAGAWYGPYTYILPPGHAYRAYFRLKTNNVTTSTEIAMLDVVDNAGQRILGLRRLRGTDFRAANTYQEFPVDFNYTDAGTSGLEFRTAYRATADLYLDRVLIVGYPISLVTSAQWRLTPGEGLKVVTVKFIDGAGNVSADLTRTVALSDTSPPAGWRDFAPEWWDGGSAPTCTVRVFDEISGLNVGSALYRYSTDGGQSWSDWLTATCTGDNGTAELETITASAVPFGQPRHSDNCIEFQIADMKGHTSSMSYTVRSHWFIYFPLAMKEYQ